MKILMPKATALWLVENTSLSFNQIANFCKMTPIEIQAIADGEMFNNILPVNPIHNNQLTREEIEKCENDKMEHLEFNKNCELIKKKTGAKYTPLTKRQNKPSCIAWMLKNHPNLPDIKICKLIGTTKNMIESIRNKTHWNIKNIVSINPVDAGLCSQYDFDMLIKNFNDSV